MGNLGELEGKICSSDPWRRNLSGEQSEEPCPRTQQIPETSQLSQNLQLGGQRLTGPEMPTMPKLRIFRQRMCSLNLSQITSRGISLPIVLITHSGPQEGNKILKLPVFP